MSEIIPLPGEKYKHYKGGTYEIISMATHTETQEKMVIYRSINYGSVYVRPLEIWNSPINPKSPIKIATRFVLIK